MKPRPRLDTLRHLKLNGMHDARAHQFTQPETFDLPFKDRLGMLLDREVLHRSYRPPGHHSQQFRKPFYIGL